LKNILALALVTGALSFGAAITISTGTASWDVSGPGVSGLVAATTLTTGENNGTWAPAPTGSSWLSWGAVEGTSCVVGQTPGNGCADTNFNATSGDTWAYILTVSAAEPIGMFKHRRRYQRRQHAGIVQRLHHDDQFQCRRS
jgi:hypothetical protein